MIERGQTPNPDEWRSCGISLHSGSDPKCATALKEWAFVVEALRTGRQIVTLRKGGIREEGGKFRADYQEFLLYPTYEHQAPGAIRSEVQSLWEQVPTGSPSDDHVTFTALGRLTGIVRVDRLEPLLQLSSYTVWTSAFIEQRFQMLPTKPLYVLFLRVYQLAQPVAHPVSAGYRGCKSWVSLTPSINLPDVYPSLSEEAFQRQASLLKKLLIPDSK